MGHSVATEKADAEVCTGSERGILSVRKLWAHSHAISFFKKKYTHTTKWKKPEWEGYNDMTFWKRQNPETTKSSVTASWGVEGKWAEHKGPSGRWKQSTWYYEDTCLSKHEQHREWSRMSVKCGLWMALTCRVGSPAVTTAPLWWGCWYRGEALWVRGQGVCGGSLCPPLHFTVRLKLLWKMKFWNFYN